MMNDDHVSSHGSFADMHVTQTIHTAIIRDLPDILEGVIIHIGTEEKLANDFMTNWRISLKSARLLPDAWKTLPLWR